MAFIYDEDQNIPVKSEIAPQQSNSFWQTAANVGKGIGRNVARSAINLATIPGEFGNFIQTLANPQKEPSQILPTKANLERLGVPQSLTRPQGRIEEAIDMTVRNLPLISFLGGGPLGAKIAADFGGSLALKGAEELGLGPIGQIGASLLGHKITNKALSKWVSNPNALFNLAKAEEANLANKATELGNKSFTNAKPFESALNKIQHSIENNSGLSVSEKNDLIKKITDYSSHIKNGEISGSALDTLNQQYNSMFKDAKRVGGEYFKAINSLKHNVIKPTEQKLAQSSPEWNKAVQGYRDITKALNFENTISELANEYPNIKKLISSPLLQGVLGLSSGGLLKGGIGAGLGALGVYGARKASDILPFITQSDTTRKLIGKSMLYTIEENIPQLTKTLQQLNKEAEKFEKKIKSGDIYKGKSNFIYD